MELLPPSLDLFTLSSGLSSLFGVGLSIWAALAANAGKKAAEQVESAFDEFRQQLVSRVILDETAEKVSRTAANTRRAVNNDDFDKARQGLLLLVEQVQTVAKHIPDPPRNRLNGWADKARTVGQMNPSVLKGSMIRLLDEIPSMVEAVRTYMREQRLGSKP